MISLDDKILIILHENNAKAKVKHIKLKLDEQDYNDIRYSTIDSAISRLSNKKYVIWEKYKPIKLTQAGLNRALEIKRHTHLLSMLLYNELKLSLTEAYEESKKMATLLSCKTINRICEKYDHPKNCHCGERILYSPTCFCDKD